MCVEAARERGLTARSRPVWDHDERPADDLGEAQAVLYVGVAGSGAVGLWHELHDAHPDLWLLGSEGVAAPWLAEAMSPAAAERTRFFVAQRAPFGFYGFEAMALILDAVAAGDGDRDAIVRAARSTANRDSILGRYSLDEHGHTTSTAYGRLAVEAGELVWDRTGPKAAADVSA
jgi:ABC-type branched-subunit amino acid transport system substrate-binding protein